MFSLPPAKNEYIDDPFLHKHGVQLYIKRDDLVFPEISGNKLRKLKFNLKEAYKSNKKRLLTFGGAYSNHIQATAAAGALYNFETIGVIRGDELAENLDLVLQENKTLRDAKNNGMIFHFIDRETYRNKDNPEFLKSLEQLFGDYYLIPEGGTNQLAIKGCEEIISHTDTTYDYVCCAVGTGGTISGIINSSNDQQQILGFPALKENYLETEIEKHTKKTNWQLIRKYHFGKYAKVTPELVQFINTFYKEHHIPLDPIYTGKMIFGIYEEIKAKRFPKNCRILAIHTGGLQGIHGVNARLKKRKETLINFLDE